jgi:hypothetical protein
LDYIAETTARFGDGLPVAEQRMFEELLLLIKDLKVKNGRIVIGMENLKMLNKLRPALERIVFSKEYARDLNAFIKAFSTVAVLQNDFFSGLHSDFTAGEYYKAIKKTAVENTIAGLTEDSIRANVLEPVRELLRTGILSGQSYASLAESLRNELTGLDGGNGSLSRYARTYATDSINRFSREYMAAISEDLGYEWFVYRGSNLETTREFCELMTKKEYVHRSEFGEVLKGLIDGHQCRIYDKTGLPYGMKAGTDEANFPVNCGGWNCGHQLIPVPEESVPEGIRARVREKVRTERVADSQKEYLQHDETKWQRAYFNSENGGYLVVNKQRIAHSQASKNERIKFDKEYSMSMVFAQNGYRIEMLEEIPGVSSADVRINGVLADLKRVSSHNNMTSYAKKAIKRQGAKAVLFEINAMTHEIQDELVKLKNLGIHVKYFITGRNKVIDV